MIARFVLYTVCVSPHQLPLMREMIDLLGVENCYYVSAEKLEYGRRELGWCEENETWILFEHDDQKRARELLSECEVLMSGIRDFDLFDYRAKSGRKTLYASERWFKPILLSFFGGKLSLGLPGWFKIFHPTYMKKVLRFRRLLTAQHENRFYYFPISMNAARDASLICCGKRSIEFERKAGGLVLQGEKVNGAYWKSRLRLWAYFVSPSDWSENKLKSLRAKQYREVSTDKRVLRILWVGRMLALKNVDKLVKAVQYLCLAYSDIISVHLTLVGDGPEKARLVRLAEGLPIEFRPFVPISEVRDIMREHDLYVFCSNGFDGWGAVVSEALEEQMPVAASRESGVGATILSEGCVFDCQNVKQIADRILHFENLSCVDNQCWTASYAAQWLWEQYFR